MHKLHLEKTALLSKSFRVLLVSMILITCLTTFVSVAHANVPSSTTRYYTFCFENFQIDNTRSRHTDTDHVAFYLKVGNKLYGTQTKDMGDLNNGSYPVNICFASIPVASPDTPIAFNYQVDNAGHISNIDQKMTDWGNLIASSLAGVGAASLIAGGAGAWAIVAGGGVEALTQAWSLFSADCDGVVVTDDIQTTRSEFDNLTAAGTYRTTRSYPGTDSPAGCGSNSQYKATWSVTPQRPPLLYNGIWKKSETAWTAVWDWAGNDFVTKSHQLQSAGYQFIDVNAYVLSNGQVRYNGVWEKSNVFHPAVWDWTANNLKQHDQQMQAQGYQLIKLNGFVLPGGQVRYNAIWEPHSDQHIAVWGWARTDFDQRASFLRTQGYQYVDLSAIVLPGGQDRYNGIWEKGNSYRPAVYGWAHQDFDNLVNKLQAQGYQLVSFNGYVLPGGQDRYNGIWEKSKIYHPAISGWGHNDFNKQVNDQVAQGYELFAVNTLVL